MPEDLTWNKDADLAEVGEPTSHQKQAGQGEAIGRGPDRGSWPIACSIFVEQGAARPGCSPGPNRSSVRTPRQAAEGIANLRAIFDLLDASGVPQENLAVDLGLARGLDYYTGVVFETTVTGWERFGSVASGGRYDNLASLSHVAKAARRGRVDRAGSPAGPDGRGRMAEGDVDHGAGPRGELPGGDPPTYARLAARLRKAGIGAEVFPDAIQIGKQMGYGIVSRSQARHG